MSLTAIAVAAPTMSSREIADLTGKEHRNVMRDIRAMLVELHGDRGVLSFEHTHRSEQNGQEYPVFRLPKRETLILVSGYNVQLRARIIDRWQELEAQQAQAVEVPQTLPEALRLAADLAEQKAEAEAALAVAAPKAQALDRIADADGMLNLTNTAKSLQIQPKRFFDWLYQHKWIYRRIGGHGPVAYQDKIHAGYLTHKTTCILRDDGTEKICEQVMVTAKGLTRLAQAISTTRQVAVAA